MVSSQVYPRHRLYAALTRRSPRDRFYFGIRNTRRGQRYKFNVINLLKAESLYNQGMQPVVYSKRNNV